MKFYILSAFLLLAASPAKATSRQVDEIMAQVVCDTCTAMDVRVVGGGGGGGGSVTQGSTPWITSFGTDSPTVKTADLDFFGKTYESTSAVKSSAGFTLSLTGKGKSWLVSVSGGRACFNVVGDTHCVDDSGPLAQLGGDFSPAVDNPSIVLSSLTAGATAGFALDGAQ